MKIESTWLTLNRNCNLLCNWCYAKDFIDNPHQMDFELAKNLVVIAKEVGSKSIFLIGGEPTIYPYFMDIVKFILSLKLRVVVVTNGIKLENEEFCKEIARVTSKVIHFGISLKGASEEDYLNNCGVYGFNKVLKAIDNCNKFQFNYSLSYVLTTEGINNIELFAKKIVHNNINKNIAFIICNDTLDKKGEVIKNSSHPMEIEKVFSMKYERICRILNNKISLHQTLPLCQCNQEILKKMIEKNQITTSCHVHKRNGLIFDSNGALLLCNNLAGFKFGEYGKDFYDSETLRIYWDSEKSIDLHKRFTTMPSEKCKSCDISELCGGGCCMQWFSNNFDSYEKYNM